jgi:glycosyltransferase involved in cell wall biosynthesis
MENGFHPLVSLVLPNYNNQHCLDLFFEKFLEHNTYDNYEFIVADDGSEDDGLALLYKWQNSNRVTNLRILEFHHRGIVLVLNDLLAAAKGNFLIRLDGDATIESDGFIEKFLDFYSIAPDKIGVITSRVITDYGSLHAIGRDLFPAGIMDRGKESSEPIGKRIHDRNVRIRQDLESIINEPAEVDTALGVCTFCDIQMARDIGGFDSNYPLWIEDDDFYFLYRLRGKKVFYLPSVEICHRFSLRGDRNPSMWSKNKTFFMKIKKFLWRREISGIIATYKLFGFPLFNIETVYINNGPKISCTLRLLRCSRHLVIAKYHTFDKWMKKILDKDHQYWEQKWGFSMLNPDMEIIKNKYAGTEILWRYDEKMKSSGEWIISEYKKQFAAKNYEKKDIKKIILIGSMEWFADSFIYFKEQGFKVYVLCPNIPGWGFQDNYAYFYELGFEIIKYSDETAHSIFEKLKMNKNTIIFGGGRFGGIVNTQTMYRDISLYELNMLYKITKYNSDNNLGAKSVRFFNGDTAWGCRLMADSFNEKIGYVDVLLFDTDLLREYVVTNIPVAKTKKHIICWVATPLQRFVHKNSSKITNKKFLSLGRVMCATEIDYQTRVVSYPFKNPGLLFFIKESFGFAKRQYSIACGIGEGIRQHSVNDTYKDRDMFYTRHKNFVFGLSHFYDVFNGSVEKFRKNKELAFSLNGQHFDLSDIEKFKSEGVEKFYYPDGWPKYEVPWNHWHFYYPFVNAPSKDVSYLMNGIIPLISHTENNLYKELVDRKMAIQVKSLSDFERVLKMTASEISEYRKNIYENREIFTFDRVANILITELANAKEEIE